MGFVKAVHKFSDALDKCMEYILFLMLLLMVVITGAQIIFRVFFTALQWSEEAVRYLLIWVSMLGAGCVYKHGGHISVTAVQELFSPKVRKILQILIHALCFALCVIVVFYGFKYFGKQGKQLSPTLRWPMKYIYLSIDFGCGFMAVHALDAVLQLVFGEDTHKEAEN